MDTLRKYGLEYCDVKTMLWNVSVLLRVLTLNIDGRNKKPIPIIFYILSLLLALGYFYVCLWSMVWFVFYRCLVTGDLLAAIIVFSLGITSEIGTVKLIYMFWHMKEPPWLLGLNVIIFLNYNFGYIIGNLDGIEEHLMSHDVLKDIICIIKCILLSAYILTIFTTLCFIYVFVISMGWFVFYRCRMTGQIIEAMVVLSLGITGEIGPFKLMYMCYHIVEIRRIAADFLECDSLMVKGSRFHENLMKCLRNVKRRAIVFWIVITGNGVLYVTMPALMPGKNLPENFFVIYGLEPMFESPNFEIAYFLMIGGVFTICYVPATVTAYLIVITGYTEAQMLALSEEMLNLWPDAIKYAESETGLSATEVSSTEFEENMKPPANDFVRRRLREIINRHATIINLLHRVETVFSQAIITGYLLLVLGILSELLGKLENTFLQMPFAFMQVSMDCFAGQRVMDASNQFEAAVYDSKWENFDKDNMKMVLVILTNSQKTMTISAGGVATLSFTSLMTVNRGIYSAYTALRSTMK